eukprot:555956-Ditylum_brightwellii.AAC.1
MQESQKDSQVRLIEEIGKMQDVDGYVNAVNPSVFAAKANALDSPNYYQAMNRPDTELFVKTMEEEMAALYDLHAWEVIDQADVPYTAEGAWHTIIESTWAFKVKRFPDDSVKRYNVRLCVRGDQQIEDMDYFETYAPVVSWSTVQAVMTLAANLGLKSRQVDFVNAFVQATLPENEEVYMFLPHGWEQPGKVLKLIKSFYGLAQAPLHWFNKLPDGLIKVICIFYVDNCSMFTHDVNDVDAIIEKIIEENFSLLVESDAAGFLEINMEGQDDGAIELKQSALIQRIIDTLGF